MASPMVEGRSPRVLDPYKKAHFSLHLSDRIVKGNSSTPSYSSLKFNHKPEQTTSTRNTTLTSSSSGRYTLTLDDKDGNKNADMYTFTGTRAAGTKSYVLIFDPAAQKATLEPLSSTYTFNLATKNHADVSSSHPKLIPKKVKNDSQDTAGTDDLFDEGGGDDLDDDPDPDNPYDFRHFLRKDGEKRGDESEYNPSSPDYRTGTGSTMNTPLMAARKPAAAPTSKPKPTQPAAKTRKRKSPEPDVLMTRKSTTKKPAPPTVRLERKASTRPPPDPKPKPKSTKPAAPPPSSKIKSAETVHSSDDSDLDAPASPDLPSPPHHRRAPSPDPDSDSDSARNVIEIEVPDARPRPKHSALASLGLGQSIGLGSLSHLRSPSAGPISLASAANSVEGSPNPGFGARGARGARARDDDGGEFEIGGLGGDEYADGEEDDEVEDRDVEVLDLGPAAHGGGGAGARKMSLAGLPVEEDEDDLLYKEMMEGLAENSSEESEEE
ncbi:hypothetical protein EJ04DRAFT_554158 [Polyplosphaeria fusca]|uniref:Transcription elongation factor Eaf N-terminal domain-containing protein n=1 Tax=Polyplosphaeria fusca TaxID=682080 RepID=A0A9P4QWA0_9PLEO|nr:hypothetical protein EJ04DRAFT_554158 [Polyplosphaeria fusca]